MDEKEKVQAEVLEAEHIPAIYVNRFVCAADHLLLRLSFLERAVPEGESMGRMAVFMTVDNARHLHALLGRMLLLAAEKTAQVGIKH